MNCALCGKELYDIENGPFHRDIDAAIECYNMRFLLELEPDDRLYPKPGMFRPNEWDRIVNLGLALLLSAVIIYAVVALTSCGGGMAAPIAATPAPAQPAPPTATPTPAPAPTPINLAGAWEFQFTPTAQTGDIAGTPQINIVEANLQQSGSTVTATSTGLFMLSEYPGPWNFQTGSICLGGETGDMAGTISTDNLSINLNLSLAAVQTQESIQATGAINPDGSLTGTYQGQNGCPFNDAGTFQGIKITTQFNAVYVGQLVNGEINSTESITLGLAQSGTTLTATGTDNGVPFALSGTVIGAFFQLPTYISGTGRSQSFSGYLPQNAPSLLVWDDVSGDQGLLAEN